MKISFIVNPIYTGTQPGFSPWDTRIGGSEEFVVEVSKRLAIYHDVQVFHNGLHGTYEKVKYRDHSEYEPGDITINVNYPEFKSEGIYWTSLVNNPYLDQFDAVCVISEYAKNNTGVEHKNVHIVPPGYDPKVIFPGKKILKQCFYASSPDRGLDTLLAAWPQVYKAHPDASLILTYGISDVELPGVICLGEVDEKTMNEVYRTSDIWCHPANGGELYCLTGVKAQVAGCVPVVNPVMALRETVRYGAFTDDVPALSYGELLISVLDKPEFRENVRDLLAKESFVTWEETTNKLSEIVQSVLEGK